MIATTKKKRIFYFDALRALAIFSVIVVHCFNTTINHVPFYSAEPSISWILAGLFGNYSRIGVDLFLMLSGALSLGRDWKIKDFLGKRIPRITLPFLFWGFVLSVILIWFAFAFPGSFNTISLNWTSFYIYLKRSYFSYNDGFAFWFFWMILGTYLIMPILNKWLLHSDLKEAEYFLIIWAITCIFEYTVLQVFPVELRFFSGASGLVVLGYYLRHTERKIFKNPYFIVSLLVISFILVVGSSFKFSFTESFHKINRFNIFIIIEVIGVFLLFRYLSTVKSPPIISMNSIYRKAMSSIAKYSYGMYLTHRAIIIIWYYFIGLETDAYAVMIVLIVLTTLSSWGLIAALNRVPYLNKMIGAK